MISKGYHIHLSSTAMTSFSLVLFEFCSEYPIKYQWYQWQSIGFTDGKHSLLFLAVFKVPSFPQFRSTLSMLSASRKQEQKGTWSKPKISNQRERVLWLNRLETLVVGDFSCICGCYSSMCYNCGMNLFQMSFSLLFANRKGWLFILITLFLTLSNHL